MSSLMSAAVIRATTNLQCRPAPVWTMNPSRWRRVSAPRTGVRLTARRLFFTSVRPVGTDASREERIWFVERTATGWSQPRPVGDVNSDHTAIVDDGVVQAAARQEVIRRYFRYACEYAVGLVEREVAERSALLMRELGLDPTDRPVVLPARAVAARAEADGACHGGACCGAAIQLADRTIVTGKNSPLMHAASAAVLNAVKQLSRVPDEIHLLTPIVIESIAGMKKDVLRMKSVSLDLDETLIALGISGATNPATTAAVARLKELAGCEFHSTHLPTPGDEAGLRRLGVHVTADPAFASRSLVIG